MNLRHLETRVNYILDTPPFGSIQTYFRFAATDRGKRIVRYQYRDFPKRVTDGP